MAFINKKAASITYGINNFTLFNGIQSASGIAINENTALSDSTFFACLRVLAQTMGQLDVLIYQKGKDKDTLITEGYMYEALNLKPNDRQTMQEIIEQIMVHANTDGNFYAKVTKYRGKINGIFPLNNAKSVSVEEIDGYKVQYTVTFPDGRTEIIPKDQMLHVRGLSYNTFKGLNMLGVTSEALGVSVATTELAGSFFKNGTVSGGFLEMDKSLTEQAQQRLAKQYEDKHMGAKKAHKFVVLEEGMKFKPNTISLKESQFVDVKTANIGEICRMLGVPPQMIGHNSGIIYNSVEEMNRFFYNSTLSSWITKIENAINLHMPKGMYIKLDVTKFVKADQKTSAEVTDIMFKSCLLTVNEGRMRMGLQPIEGGDVMAIGTNNITLGNLQDLTKLTQENDNQQLIEERTGDNDDSSDETKVD